MPRDTRAAVARREPSKEELDSLVAFVNRQEKAIAAALPRHLDGERMTRIALTAVRQTPDLALCSELSFAGALMQTAAMGLEPNTPGMESFLVPYRNHGAMEAQLIVGYKGFVKLYHQHPAAGDIDARAVYPDDDFDWSRGSDPYLRHKERKVPVELRGDPTHYWAGATLTSGRFLFEVLTAEEVKDLRNGKVGTKGDIPDPQRWMERKTAIRQLAHLLPVTPNMARATQVDERPGSELYKAAAAERLDLDPGAGLGRPREGEEDATVYASPEQLVVIMGRWEDLDWDNDHRAAWLAERIGRRVSDPGQMTEEEAEAVIAALPDGPPEPGREQTA
jgi:recombination protein RecT